MNIKMYPTSCAICGSKGNFDILYPKNFNTNDINIDVFSARRLPDGSHYQMVKCKKDGLVRSNPVLSESILSKLYKESKFTYGNETTNLIDTYITALKPVLKKVLKTDSILEVGCGNGFILEALYNIGYQQVFGVEPSIEAVEKANKQIKKNIVVDMLKPGVFKNKKFKFIFFFQTLDHISDPNNFLEICNKMLEPGGYILAFNHNVESLSSAILKEKSPIIDIEHTYLYSPFTITRLFEKHNFETIQVYSPANTVSTKHLIWLLPLPRLLKVPMLKMSIPNLSLKVKLGNLCIISQKV